MGRNPLKSGQGFNDEVEKIENILLGRNPLKSGQGFNFLIIPELGKALESQSP